MDEKIKGMEDFKMSVDFAKTLNHTLQDKMLEANEERAAALFTKQKIDEIAQGWKDVAESDDVFGVEKPSKQDHTDKAILDEEVSQMEKAIVVLMGEYKKRKSIRDRNRAAAGAVTKRVAALMIFQKKKEAFSKIKQSQLDEIEAFKKKKEEYHMKQREIEKQKEKEEALEKQKEKELMEKHKKESTSSFGQDDRGRERLDSNVSDEGLDLPTGQRRGLSRLDSVVGTRRGLQNATNAFEKRRGFNRTRLESVDDFDEDVFAETKQRKDSKKAKEKEEKEKKKGGKADLSRAAHTVNNVFYWDRLQNQKNKNTTIGGR